MTIKAFNARRIRSVNWQAGLILSLLITFGLNQTAVADVQQSSKAVYVGRTQVAAPHYSQRHIIKQSSGYDARYQYSDGGHAYNGYDNEHGDYQNGYQRHNKNRRYSNQPRVSASFYYQAPTTTTITRNVQIIPPQNGVGDVYYSEDSYYLYPPQPIGRPYYQRPYQPLIPVTINPRDTENRSKQWTEKSDFGR